MGNIGLIIVIILLLFVFWLMEQSDKDDRKHGIKRRTIIFGIIPIPDSFFKWYFLVMAIILLLELLQI